MNRSVLGAVAALAVLAAIATSAQTRQPRARLSPVSVALDQLKWSTMPDGSGRETAELFGNRTKAALFGYLVRWPKNAVAKAHSHPEDRYGMVLSGTFYYSHGRKFDAGTLQREGVGTYFTEPAGEPHFGASKDEPVILYSSAWAPTAPTLSSGRVRARTAAGQRDFQRVSAIGAV